MRSLVLAGGGMRVAWQAGVVRALEEEGLAFDHVDGASGGILTAAMMLSGVSGAEMCERWRALPAAAFTSLLPLTDYLRGPWSLPALGDAEAIIDTVFPCLGIDVDRMRQSELTGTVQIVEFTSKECLALEPKDLDASLLAAGLSLPGWITPLRRDGRIYTDAVWVRDAGVREAIRRGADDVWLVWCIGNSPYWGDGPLEQYVHTIEMSAMGALLADLELARALGHEFTLHVITPPHPLPLDPEFYLGRISADALAAMGFRDAHAYLHRRTPDGVPKDATCTQMLDPPLSARITDRLQGRVGDQAVTVTLTVEFPLEAPPASGSLAGAVTSPQSGTRYLADGAIVHESGRLIYSGTLRRGGNVQPFTCTRELIDDPGWDAWSDFTTAYVRIGAETGTLTMDVGGVAAMIASIEPVGAHGILQRADVVRRLPGILRSLRRSSGEGDGSS
jgi:NTE family protein